MFRDLMMSIMSFLFPFDEKNYEYKIKLNENDDPNLYVNTTELTLTLGRGATQ